MSPLSPLRRATPWVVGLLALALVASSCSSKQQGFDNVSPPSVGAGGSGSTTTTATTAPEYAATYREDPKCRVERLGDPDPGDPAKPKKWECGFLTVPENRTKPRGKKIDLQVVRIRATGPTPRPDPLVYLEGGPGGSALLSVDFFRQAFKPLLEDRDLILMDQRGTGYSEPTITCAFEFSRATETQELVDIMSACYDRLAGGNIDMDAYNTKENAADFADLRKALAIPEWNLFGVSYGTRLALQIMGAHPEGVRSVVLDSAFPGDVDTFDEQPANAARSFQAVFAACAADPVCGRENPDLENGFATIVEELNRRPYKNTSVFEGETAKFRQYDGTAFLSEIFRSLYSEDQIRYLPRIITLARRDSGKAIREMIGIQAPRTARPDGRTTDRLNTSDGFFYSVMCAEEAAKADAANMEALIPPVHPTLRATLITWISDTLAICKKWATAPSPVAVPTADIPTLALAGSFDPITPPAWTQKAKAQLPKSRYVEVAGAGHGVYFVGPCESDLVKQFLNDPITKVAETGGCPDVTGFR